MERYFCDTGCQDKLDVYLCEEDKGYARQVGFVMSDSNNCKISVVMDRNDVERLQRQLTGLLESISHDYPIQNR